MAKPKKTTSSLIILRELKIIKTEIRDLQRERRFSEFSIRSLESKLKDETALIREQNIEMKDEILGEIKAMREELEVTLGQYQRQDKRISKLEKAIPTSN